MSPSSNYNEQVKKKKKYSHTFVSFGFKYLPKCIFLQETVLDSAHCRSQQIDYERIVWLVKRSSRASCLLVPRITKKWFEVFT